MNNFHGSRVPSGHGAFVRKYEWNKWQRMNRIFQKNPILFVICQIRFHSNDSCAIFHTNPILFIHRNIASKKFHEALELTVSVRRLGQRCLFGQGVMSFVSKSLTLPYHLAETGFLTLTQTRAIFCSSWVMRPWGYMGDTSGSWTPIKAGGVRAIRKRPIRVRIPNCSACLIMCWKICAVARASPKEEWRWSRRSGLFGRSNQWSPYPGRRNPFPEWAFWDQDGSNSEGDFFRCRRWR